MCMKTKFKLLKVPVYRVLKNRQSVAVTLRIDDSTSLLTTVF